MGLITAQELAKVTKLNKYGNLGLLLSDGLLNLLKLDKINHIYEKNKNLSGIDFLDAVLEDVGVRMEFGETELKRLPTAGAYIVVANHPLGAIDGIMLLRLMLSIDPNFKIIGNFILNKIKPLSPFIFPVNPFEYKKEAKSSISGLKNALIHLKNGYPLGIFPAGEVSSVLNGDGTPIDKDWTDGAIKFIKKAGVPVVPLYFHACNSRLFYLLSALNSDLRTAKLPSELLNQKNKSITIRIGRTIEAEVIRSFDDIEKLGDFLKRMTYLLSYPLEPFKKTIKIPKFKSRTSQFKQLIDEVPKSILIKEINNIREAGSRLFAYHHYEVFLMKAEHSPLLLREICRLRELTFRKVNEGTGKALDTDRFDYYYRHLLLWDAENCVIVGAYRIGFGRELYEHNGVKAFYLDTLFKFSSDFHGFLKSTLEMGRAFIIPSYQQKPFSLLLLWQGIVRIVKQNPEYKHLLGAVSISNTYCDFSRAAMINFMYENYFDHQIAKMVVARNPISFKIDSNTLSLVSMITNNEINLLDRLIRDIEPGGIRLPVLIKKYFLQNAKVIGFNVDKNFANVIDGLFFISVENIPEKTMNNARFNFE